MSNKRDHSQEACERECRFCILMYFCLVYSFPLSVPLCSIFFSLCILPFEFSLSLLILTSAMSHTRAPCTCRISCCTRGVIPRDIHKTYRSYQASIQREQAEHFSTLRYIEANKEELTRRIREGCRTCIQKYPQLVEELAGIKQQDICSDRLQPVSITRNTNPVRII